MLGKGDAGLWQICFQVPPRKTDEKRTGQEKEEKGEKGQNLIPQFSSALFCQVTEEEAGAGGEDHEPRWRKSRQEARRGSAGGGGRRDKRNAKRNGSGRESRGKAGSEGKAGHIYFPPFVKW